MKRFILLTTLFLSTYSIVVSAIDSFGETTLYKSTTEVDYLKGIPRSKFICGSFRQASAAIIEPIADGLWYESRIWPNGKLPDDTDDVVIPAGRNVIMAGTCRAKTILVNGKLSAVNWQVGGAWINLETESILVSGVSAVMEIGTETQPYFADGKCTITLKGAKVMNASGTYKGIVVEQGGTLDLHGKKKMSWTNLSATANIDAKSITLKQAVDWEVGDVIVLTSTALADGATKSWENVDQVEIEAISTDKKTITLKTALKFKHIGGSKSYTRAKDGKTWEVNIQGEVGLLSHHIKIQSDIAETDVEGFGGHIMVMKNTTARVENVELYKMGQKAVMGRYPFHWHLGENTAVGDYFRNSSVHKSFNRAVTIHGTDYVTVDGIVAYDHIGHGIFLENGGERYNTIKNNVVFVTRRPQKGYELTPSDNQDDAPQNRTPSSYWITNPNNYFENNVAAGTEGTGFWIIQPDGAPMAASGQLPYFAGVNPTTENLGLFKGFVAHTCMNGWDIFDRLNPDHSIKANLGWDVTTNQYLENGLFYGNDNALYCGLGSSANNLIVFRNCAFSDNKLTTMLAGDLTLENCLFNADSDLGVFDGKREFFRFYDGPGRHHNCHFENWNRPYTYMITQEEGGGATENFNPSFRGTTKGFSEPFTFKFFRLPDHEGTRTRKVGQFFKDYDGGLTGKAHTTIVRDIPFLTDGHEYRHPSWRNAARSDYYFGSLFMHAFEATETKMSIVRSKIGTADACFYDSGTPSNGTYKFPMIVNQGFLYTYYFGKAPQTGSGSGGMFLFWSRADEGDLGYMCLKGLGKLSGFSIQGMHGSTIEQLSSKSAVENATNNTYFIDANGDVYIKVKSTGADKNVIFALNWNGLGTFEPSLPCTSNLLTGVTAFDTDGDGASDLDETERCGLVNNAADLNFEFNSTREYFQTHQIAADINIHGNDGSLWLLRADKASDPFVFKNELNFNGSEVPQLKVSIKSEASGAFQLFWTTSDQTAFTEDKSVKVLPKQTNVFEELVFDMSNNLSWVGKKITRLRLDFPPDVDNNRHTLIDYIKGPNATNNGCLVTKWDYNFGAEKWTSDQLTHTINDGFVNYTITGGDPKWVSEDGLSANASDFKFIRVRIKTTANGIIELFWGRTDALGFGGSRYASVNVTANSDFQEVLIPLTNNIEWKNIIDQLRIDFQFPIGQQGQIDLISLENADLRDCKGIWMGTSSNCMVTKVNEITETESSLSVFPNPSNDGIFNLSRSINWKVYSVLGKELMSGNSNQIKLSGYPRGVYLIKVNDKVERIVVE